MRQISASEPTSRRRILGAVTIGGMGGVAGCFGLPFGDNQPDLPPIEQGWLSINPDGTADVVFLFDGDIQSKLEQSDMSGDDLIQKAEEQDLELSLEPVSIDDTGDLPASKTVEGVFQNAAIQNDRWAAEPWYTTALIAFTGDIDLTEDARIDVRFPSGFTYVLPRDHVQARDMATFDLDRDHEGLFDYTADSRSFEPREAIPHIRHFDYPAFTWMRPATEYRARLLNRTQDLFDFDWYEQQTYDAIREGVASIGERLTLQAIEGAITGPLPSEATAPLDIKGIHDALTDDYSTFRASLESINELSLAARNNTWMAPLSDDETGFPKLRTLAEKEWRWRIPALTTAFDAEQFRRHLTALEDTLDQQYSLAQTLRYDSTYTDTRPSNHDYWQDLYTLAGHLLEEFLELIQAEQTAIENLKSEL